MGYYMENLARYQNKVLDQTHQNKIRLALFYIETKFSLSLEWRNILISPLIVGFC